MQVIRKKKKYIGKTRTTIEVPEKELIVVDEDISGIDITAICYDRSAFFKYPEFKEFGINIRLTAAETIALKIEIDKWLAKHMEKIKHQVPGVHKLEAVIE